MDASRGGALEKRASDHAQAALRIFAAAVEERLLTKNRSFSQDFNDLT
jgi:hypothetical protein